jgi:hypothetical protein
VVLPKIFSTGVGLRSAGGGAGPVEPGHGNDHLGSQRGSHAVGARLAAAHLCASRSRPCPAYLLDSGVHPGIILFISSFNLAI